MLETIWAVTSTALLVFCAPVAYRKGFSKGRFKGSMEVLDAWKEHNRVMEEIRNEQKLN